MGPPSVYFVFSVPQDGVAAPGRLQRQREQLPAQPVERQRSGAAKGTLTVPDAGRLLHRHAHRRDRFPPTAQMLTGGLGYSYSVITRCR
jgi:hypothetical protein